MEITHHRSRSEILVERLIGIFRDDFVEFAFIFIELQKHILYREFGQLVVEPKDGVRIERQGGWQAMHVCKVGEGEVALGSVNI